MLDKLILLSVGGSIGTISRYLLTIGCRQWLGFSFPWGTITANLLGCLVMGVAFAVIEQSVLPNSRWPLLVMTGFLGALTTFSTLELEVFEYLKTGQIALAALYVGGSLVAGLLLLWTGYSVSLKILAALG